MKHKILISILFAILFTVTKSGAQNDSVNVIISEELTNIDDYKFKQKYKYLDINMKEEKTLVKIGMPTSTILNLGRKCGYQNYTLIPSIEIKILPSISILFETIYHYSKEEYITFSGDRHRSILDYINLTLGGRYYYNMKKRMDDGTSANNFNDPYIGLSVTPFFVPSTQQLSYTSQNIAVVYGIQRRLGNVAYIDGQVYINYLPNYGAINLGVSVKFGLAFGW